MTFFRKSSLLAYAAIGAGLTLPTDVFASQIGTSAPLLLLSLKHERSNVKPEDDEKELGRDAQARVDPFYGDSTLDKAESRREWLNKVKTPFTPLRAAPRRFSSFCSNKKNKEKRFVFSLADTHGCWRSYPLILQALEAMIANKPKKLDVVIAGDLADRGGEWGANDADAPDRLGSTECMKFLEDIATLLNDHNLGSLYVVFGNHDTQNVADFQTFVRKVGKLSEDLPIKLCSNIADAFLDVSLSPGVLDENTLFFPYGTNYANGVDHVDEKDFLSMFDQNAQFDLLTFYRDGLRDGCSDGIFFEGFPLPIVLNEGTIEELETYKEKLKKCVNDENIDKKLETKLQENEKFLRISNNPLHKKLYKDCIEEIKKEKICRSFIKERIDAPVLENTTVREMEVVKKLISTYMTAEDLQELTVDRLLAQMKENKQNEAFLRKAAKVIDFFIPEIMDRFIYEEVWGSETEEAKFLRAEVTADNLNPIARSTVQSFCNFVNNWFLNKKNEGKKLNVVFMAHDHYIRPLILLELVSRFCPSLRLPRKYLENMNIWIAGGHEHDGYARKATLCMTAQDGNVVDNIPVVAVGPEMYGKNGCLLAIDM